MSYKTMHDEDGGHERYFGSDSRPLGGGPSANERRVDDVLRWGREEVAKLRERLKQINLIQRFYDDEPMTDVEIEQVEDLLASGLTIAKISAEPA